MKPLLTISKYITAIGVIGGAALWFDAKSDKADENSRIILERVDEINEKVEYINVEQSFISEDIAAIHDTMEKYEDKLNGIEKQSDYLAWLIKNLDTFTPEQMELLLMEWDKKKVALTLPDSIQREREWEREWGELMKLCLKL